VTNAICPFFLNIDFWRESDSVCLKLGGKRNFWILTAANEILVYKKA
jgi:hypothetical protein